MMKSFLQSSIMLLASIAPSTAFVTQYMTSCAASRTQAQLNAKITMTPEMEAAITDVREAASLFGEETAGFANRWIDRMLAGDTEGTAAGILDECVLDDDQSHCDKFADALDRLDKLLGVGAREQY